MSSRRDWKSVVFEVEVSSRYRCCDGSQASRSYFLAALRAEVVDRDVDDAVRDAEPLEDLLLDAQQPLVLGRRLRRLDEREHLDLVELVHAEDAARVLAGGARLAPEAGREPGVAARQPRP